MDVAVFLVALGVTFLSVWGRRRGPKSSSVLETLLIGRRLSLPLFVGTLVSTWYGGIMGVTQLAYEQGLYNFVTQGVFWYVSYLIFAFFLAENIRSQRATGLPDLMLKALGPKSCRLVAILNTVNLMPLSTTISMGLFIRLFWPAIPLPWAMGLGLFLSLSYSLMGGFRAIVYSDFVQCFLMVAGVVAVLVFSIKTYGPPSVLAAHLPPHYFHLTGKESLGETLSWGILAMGALINPNFHHRCSAARSPSTAKWGILVSTLIWMAIDLSITLSGMYAQMAMPGLPPQEAYLTYAFQLLPPGFKGLLGASILAILMSTLDSYLFLGGSTVSFDLLRLKSAHQVKWQKVATLGVALGTWALATLFDGNILQVWKLMGTYNLVGLLLPFLMRRFLTDNLFVAVSIIPCLVATLCWIWARPLTLPLGAFLGLSLIFGVIYLNNRPKIPPHGKP